MRCPGFYRHFFKAINIYSGDVETNLLQTSNLRARSPTQLAAVNQIMFTKIELDSDPKMNIILIKNCKSMLSI